MVHPVTPADLHQLITNFKPKADNENDMEVDDTLVTYGDLDTEQRDIVDEVLEEYDHLPKDLLAQAVSQLDANSNGKGRQPPAHSYCSTQ